MPDWNVERAFVTVACWMNGIPSPDLSGCRRDSIIREGGSIQQWTARYIHDEVYGKGRFERHYCNTRDEVAMLWHTGPKKDFVPDDLELAALLEFLREELHWPPQ